MKSILGLLLALCCGVAQAVESVEGLPVHLKADHLRYLDFDQEVEALGNAEFDFQDTHIEAEALRLDLLSNTQTGRGKVHIVKGDVPILCISFRYEIDSEKLDIGHFSA